MKVLASLFITLALSACDVPIPDKENKELSTRQKREMIDSLMQAQQDAWNTGGLEAYMQTYKQSDSLIFIGSRGLNYGWNTTLSNYQKSYPDKEAMGTLEFKSLEFKDLGSEYSFLIGRWNLYRSADTLSGSYSLLWQWDGKSASIIADHSSYNRQSLLA